MTRIVRVNTCAECPHAIGPTKCRAAPYEDDAGRLLLREFDPETYPKIPVWCPLEIYRLRRPFPERSKWCPMRGIPRA